MHPCWILLECDFAAQPQDGFTELETCRESRENKFGEKKNPIVTAG